MKSLVYVFIGGGTGSVLRYLAQLLANRSTLEAVFPVGTFAVNILGSLLIGLFYSLSVRFDWSEATRLLLTVGLCGGFTTFSAFSNNSLSLLKNEFYGTLAIYVLLSLLAGISCTFLGGWIGKHLF